MSAPPALHLDGVGVTIDGVAILADVDWSVRPGERWVVLGPNGAGKTTLVRIAALRLHPSTGTVEVLGATLGRVDIRRHRHRIGLTSAAIASALRPDIRVVDVVVTALNGALEPWWHTYGETDLVRARSLLDRFGVGHLAEHPFGTLSSGERQRTLLARALVTDPGLLLLDEPGAGLDLPGREELLAHLTALGEDPTTPPAILVTHHLEEVPPGFTHALLLRAGRVTAAGAIEEVLQAGPLSACFGLPLEVSGAGGRYSARAAGPVGSIESA